MSTFILSTTLTSHAEVTAERLISLEAMDLSEALSEVAEIFDVSLIYAPEMVSGYQTKPISGDYTLDEILTFLTVDSPLVGLLSVDDTILIVRRNSQETEEDPIDMGSNTKKSLLLGASAILTTGAAAAQTVPVETVEVAEETSTRTLGTITVTTRKREESLQDVPLAISVFSSDDIEKRSLNQLEDIALQTPGLAFEDYSNSGYGTPVIRGASQFVLTTLEQNVSVFYDGVYIPRGYAFDLGLTNVERIEVVKGPQSALYGANSFAGAINYVSKERDTSEFFGTVKGGLGSDGLGEFSGSINVPLIEDMLAFSLSANHSEFDGDFDNNAPNASQAPNRGTDDSIGGWDKDALAMGLTFEKGPITAKVDYSVFDSFTEDGPHFRLNNTAAATDFNCSPGGFTGANRVICGEIPGAPIPGASGVEGLLIDPRAYSEIKTEVYRGELGYAINDNVSLNYLYGRIESDIFAVGEATRDPITGLSIFGLPAQNIFTIGPFGNFNYQTHEARADFEFDNLTASAGIFVMDGTDYDGFNNVFAPLGGLDEIAEPDTVFIQTDTETKAVFGSITVPLLENRMNISLEGRYSETEKTSGDNVFKTDPFTPRLTVDYALSDDNLIYGTLAKGVKNGGINTSSVVLEDSETFFDDDENITYEIGSKNTLMNGRGTINAALFFIEWDNLQSSISPINAGPFTTAVTTNIGSATSQGLELDGTFRLTDNFTINGGLAVIDATYDEGTTSARNGNLCDGIVCETVTDITSDAFGDAIIGGNKLPRSPDFQWNIGAQYDGQITNGWDYFIRGDVAGQGSQYAEEVNLAEIPERTIVNLRGGVTSGPVTAEVWVTNLFDETYVANAFFINFAFGTDYVPTYGPAQRWGVSLKYDF